jgi:hypothetical protein
MFVWLSFTQTLAAVLDSCEAGVGAPPWTWPRDELLVDVAGKAMYAFVTGAVADRLAAAAGVSPGQRHAELAGGRRLHDVGPVAGGRTFAGH